MTTRDQYIEKMRKDIIEGNTTLPNGCTLYWRTNDMGCREYFSDECGVPYMIWDTTVINNSSLLSALTQEETLRRHELVLKNEDSRNHK